MIAALLLAAALPEARDWPATTLADARALHDDIRANHSGPVNAADRGFVDREAAAYARLRRRAGAVRGITGYRFALKEYIASYDDGHVQFWIEDDAALPAANWPGFLTGFDALGAQRVMTRVDDAPVPLGAELKGCDGVPAATLAARDVGAFEGRWGLPSMRVLRGGYLLVDRGNPFTARPVACDFAAAGRVRTVTLSWQPIESEALTGRLSAVNGIAHPAIGAWELPDGTRWYGLSSFDGDPAGKTARALGPLIAAMRADRVALARAPAIVLDLRGNGGGSSDWSTQIARVLWGERRVAALDTPGSYVEWRVSSGTIAAIEGYQQQFDAAPDADPSTKAYFRTITSGLKRARNAGLSLWREPASVGEAMEPKTTGSPASDPAPISAPIFIVTDAGCGSACLDAVDTWRALGAIQVGRETSADTLYMDIRQGKLPSGLAGFAVPMKVYRGRSRGSNIPWTPVHRFDGDLTDTPALQRWVAGLPERRR